MATQPPCDPCHTDGNEQYHADSGSRIFINQCKEKLPFREDIIEVGPTGYPSIPGHDQNEVYWCYDEIGRFYLFTGLPEAIAIFQRYLKGDILRGYSSLGWWSCLSHDQLDRIGKQLKIRD